MPDLPAPDGWQWKPLLELAKLESGHTPSRKKPEYWGGDVPWIGIKDATGNNGATLDDTMQHTNDLGIANSAARVLPENTVCLSRTASVGYVVVMGRPMATSQDFANWVCGPDLDHRFLKYVLLLENEALHRFSHGSTHKTIYYPELKAFHICVPDIGEQGRIADCLQVLDDKIASNAETISTLTETSAALFRSWFVDFDPVWSKLEGKSPSHMGDELGELFPSSFYEDGIPVGWKSLPIYDISTVRYGAAFKSKLFNTEGQGRPLARIRDLKKGKGGVSTTECLPNEYLLLPGDIVVGMDGDFTSYVWSAGPTLMNQRVCCFQPKEAMDRAFLRNVLPALLKFEEETAVATTVIHLGKKDIDNFTIVVPSKDIREAFGKIANPMLDLIAELGLQQHELRAAREQLMPALLSGAYNAHGHEVREAA